MHPFLTQMVVSARKALSGLVMAAYKISFKFANKMNPFSPSFCPSRPSCSNGISKIF